MTDTLDFQLVREDYPDRWHRAQQHAEDAIYERTSWKQWLVCLPDGGEPWLTSLYTDGDTHHGDCRAPPDADREHNQCPGHAFHDGPCAHLCALRISAWLTEHDFNTITDTQGRDIRLIDAAAAEQNRTDHAIEKAARTDGGPHL